MAAVGVTVGLFQVSMVMKTLYKGMHCSLSGYLQKHSIWLLVEEGSWYFLKSTKAINVVN